MSVRVFIQGRDGGENGPYDEEAVLDALQAGELSPMDRCRIEGEAGFRRLGEVFVRLRVGDPLLEGVGEAGEPREDDSKPGGADPEAARQAAEEDVDDEDVDEDVDADIGEDVDGVVREVGNEVRGVVMFVSVRVAPIVGFGRDSWPAIPGRTDSARGPSAPN